MEVFYDLLYFWNVLNFRCNAFHRPRRLGCHVIHDCYDCIFYLFVAVICLSTKKHFLQKVLDRKTNVVYNNYCKQEKPNKKGRKKQ
nr:MAG TPA: hypothetical protein [Caudoviricetes sp.]